MKITKKISVITNEGFCPKNHPCPVLRQCPFGAIEQRNPFSAPKIIKEKCRDCGLCTKMCRVFQAVPA